ncbi:hypothetical protein GGTG_03610 [Gaeumannomyces tritici R3-111a-1]|uniref:Rhodanese domain-containing protein n=1 Tax=Gaeumannomyces tritici (strain R3-111a-1) TaxID=644352 RepID=J3NQQ4_GAET3|nr:hypothetical protein GGTG_03610 [Gaeumannomyces tritici R3-111a-1]EJT78510.1 hypothetical protein GGTG_03610 [Gaeumannomyces tritici R3-111a-1]
MSSEQQQKPEAQQPWWAAFPAPKSDCASLDPAEVLKLLEGEGGDGTPKDFLLVDVRRTDWEGGTIATSINLPAHTLYQTRRVVYDLCKRAGIKRIIFYCGSCSHGGRGWKCAGWMQDLLDEVGEKEIKAFTLGGGIKAWVAQYESRQMEWYEAAAWEQSK